MLAAGGAERFDGAAKQMLRVPEGGEPIIERTVRIARDVTDDVTVVSWRPELAPDGAYRLDVGRTRSVAATLLAAIRSAPYDGECVALLGDVSFADVTLRRILGGPRTSDVRFTGRKGRNPCTGKGGELFAVAFRGRPLALMGALVGAAAVAAEGGGDGIPGRLWDVYRRIDGRTLEALLASGEDGLFAEVGESVTDDIDTPEEYARYLAAIPDAAMLDDPNATPTLLPAPPPMPRPRTRRRGLGPRHPGTR